MKRREIVKQRRRGGGRFALYYVMSFVKLALVIGIGWYMSMSDWEGEREDSSVASLPSSPGQRERATDKGGKRSQGQRREGKDRTIYDRGCYTLPPLKLQQLLVLTTMMTRMTMMAMLNNDNLYRR